MVQYPLLHVSAANHNLQEAISIFNTQQNMINFTANASYPIRFKILLWLPEDDSRLPKHVGEDTVSLYMFYMQSLVL